MKTRIAVSVALFVAMWSMFSCTALQKQTVETELVSCGENAATSQLPSVQNDVLTALSAGITETEAQAQLEQVAEKAGENAVVCAIGVLLSNAEQNIAAGADDGGVIAVAESDFHKLVLAEKRASAWLAKHKKSAVVAKDGGK